MHGTRLDAYATRADMIFLEEAASEVVGLAAAHGLFIRQFNEWRDYTDDASGEPSAEMVEAAAGVVRSIEDAPEIIGEDVKNAATVIAEAAIPPLTADPADRPPSIVQRELPRSVGNILSALFEPLVAYARKLGPALEEGSLEGAKEFAKKATFAIAFAGTAYVLSLAAGLPGEFGWVIPVLTLLKMKLKM